MTRTILYTLIALLLFLTVPWFFSAAEFVQVMGMPVWAAYSLGMSVLFALVVVLLLPRCWHLSARDDGD